MTRIFLLPLLFVLSGAAFGQKKAWTLQECVEYAIQHNIQVRQSANNVLSARNTQDAAYANLLPNLNLQGGYFWNFGLNIDPITNLPSRTDRQTANLALTSSWVLFDGGRNWNQISRSRVDLAAAQYRLEGIRNDIGMNVASQYLQVLLNKELFRIAEEQVQQSSRQLERVKKMVDAGAAPEADLFTAESQLARDEQNAIATENNVQLSLLSLAQLLMLEDPYAFDIVEPEMEVAPSGLLTMTPNQIYETAIGIQPKVRAAEYDLKSSEESYDMAVGTYLPTLSLNGQIATNYSNQIPVFEGTTPTEIPIGYYYDNQGIPQPVYTQTEVPFGREVKSFNNQVSDNINQFIGLSLSIPLFNRLQTRNQVRNARIQIENNRLNLENTRNTLRQDIQRAHADATASLKSYQAAQKSVAASKANFENAEQRRSVGAISQYDFDTARNNYLRSQSELLQAKYDYIFKIKVLEFYLTNELPTQIQQP